MKKSNFVLRMAQAVCLLAMVMTAGFTLVSCDKEKDEPSYADFVDINIVKCERVGRVLVIDFTVANKLEKMLGLSLYSQTVTDSNGESYGSAIIGSSWNHATAIGSASGNYSENLNSRIGSKDTVAYRVKVGSDFDPSEKAGNVKLEMRVGIDGEQFEKNLYVSGNIPVTDNRIKSHGVQTNDRNIEWTVNRCYRDETEGTLYVEFTIKNNTGQRLKDFGMFNWPYDQWYDNLGNSGNNFAFHWGTGGEFADIAINSSVTGVFSIENFPAAATELTADICLGVDNYPMDDDIISFITIPIEK